MVLFTDVHAYAPVLLEMHEVKWTPDKSMDYRLTAATLEAPIMTFYCSDK